VSNPVRVGVVDSGVAAGSGLPIEKGCRFSFGDDGALTLGETIEDRLGHGTEVSRMICGAAPQVVLLQAQVFERGFETAPALVAAGLDWLVAEGVQIVNMSFGLRTDRWVLSEACRRADEQGMLLIASAPAQGAVCYPAGYPEVVAVTGDARCALGEVTDLQGRQADFGTWCASPEHGGGAVAGASAAAAHFSGLAAAHLEEWPEATRSDLLAHFRRRAVQVGPERRSRQAGS